MITEIGELTSPINSFSQSLNEDITNICRENYEDNGLKNGDATNRDWPIVHVSWLHFGI
jgi:hypothetical protein